MADIVAHPTPYRPHAVADQGPSLSFLSAAIKAASGALEEHLDEMDYCSRLSAPRHVAVERSRALDAITRLEGYLAQARELLAPTEPGEAA